MLRLCSLLWWRRVAVCCFHLFPWMSREPCLHGPQFVGEMSFQNRSQLRAVARLECCQHHLMFYYRLVPTVVRHIGDIPRSQEPTCQCTINGFQSFVVARL